MEYSLELDRACESIKKEKAKTVVIQLPEGLRPKANEIADYLHEKTNAVIIIWAGSCYGACDVPNVENLGADMLIQWGHQQWK